ncbi:hypothetical protein ACC848_37935, partial [Rhizobium johnstonii]
HPQSSLVFTFHGRRQPTLNRAWLDALTHTANAGSGLSVVPEPASTGSDEAMRGGGLHGAHSTVNPLVIRHACTHADLRGGGP